VSHQNNKYQSLTVQWNANIDIFENSLTQFPATILKISPGDLTFQSEINSHKNDRVAIHCDHIPSLTGKIINCHNQHFKLALTLTKRERLTLVEQLFITMNKEYSANILNRRRSPRQDMGARNQRCYFEQGGFFDAKLIDISVSGAALESRRKPSIGTELLLDQRQATVIRHTLGGFAVVFKEETNNQYRDKSLDANASNGYNPADDKSEKPAYSLLTESLAGIKSTSLG